METEKLLRLKGVKEYIPLPTPTIYAKIKALRFPKQYKYGGTACWKLSEIQEYINKGEEWVHQKLLKQKELEKVIVS
jgi:predicted DNA-binding transcriptional regulator AlpA